MELAIKGITEKIHALDIEIQDIVKLKFKLIDEVNQCDVQITDNKQMVCELDLILQGLVDVKRKIDKNNSKEA